MKKLSVFLVLIFALTLLTACDEFSFGFNKTIERDPAAAIVGGIGEATTPAETTGGANADTTGGTPSQDDGIAGKYCGSYTYEGDEYYVELTINADGTYKRIYLKNGESHKTNEGDWILDESGRVPKIRIYLNAEHTTANIYEYYGSYIKESNDKVFQKQ